MMKSQHGRCLKGSCFSNRRFFVFTLLVTFGLWLCLYFNLNSLSLLPRIRNIGGLDATEQKIFALTELLNSRLQLVKDGDIRKRPACIENKRDGLCTNTTCVEALEAQPPEDRIRKLITSPSLTLSEEQLKSIEAINDNIPENDLIIVSGVSSNHYDEMQAMFRNLHEVVFPKMKNFSMVLFDLGLTAKQRNETEQNCRCQVLRFPFPKFDRHIRILRCYGFKPLIIRAVMFKARKLLVWQDSSVRWNSKFVDAFDRALRFGQQVFEKKFSDGVTHNTVKQMFDYLDEKVCTYQPFGEVSAGIQMLRNDPLIVEALLNPWARCALEKSCMCPTKSTYSISTCKGRARLHRCHRFDQSAYSLLLAKLYGMERYKMIIPLNKQPCGVSRGGKESNYFSSLQANDSHNFGKAPTKQ